MQLAYTKKVTVNQPFSGHLVINTGLNATLVYYGQMS